MFRVTLPYNLVMLAVDFAAIGLVQPAAGLDRMVRRVMACAGGVAVVLADVLALTLRGPLRNLRGSGPMGCSCTAPLLLGATAIVWRRQALVGRRGGVGRGRNSPGGGRRLPDRAALAGSHALSHYKPEDPPPACGSSSWWTCKPTAFGQYEGEVIRRALDGEAGPDPVCRRLHPSPLAAAGGAAVRASAIAARDAGRRARRRRSPSRETLITAGWEEIFAGTRRQRTVADRRSVRTAGDLGPDLPGARTTPTIRRWRSASARPGRFHVVAGPRAQLCPGQGPGRPAGGRPHPRRPGAAAMDRAAGGQLPAFRAAGRPA